MKAILLIACGLTAAAGTAQESLFNGKDLTGWRVFADQAATGGYVAEEPTWAVVDGCIRTTGTPFGYLRTERSDYADFRLHVEYRWWRQTKKPNSGVFVRLARETGSFVPVTVETQLCVGEAGDVMGLGGLAIAGVAPRDAYDPAKPLSGVTKVPRKGSESEKPFGEWNVLEVEIRGDTLVNWLNGVEQNRVKGISGTTGAIALQSEGGAVEFRNVWIERLVPPSAEVRVALETSLGEIELQLDAEKAPLTVSNFLAYVKGGHYKETVFHRVIPGFMIQGGGFTAAMEQKPTAAPIRNEAANGLKNARGTVAMARTSVVDSATSQFFINLKDNAFLDFRAPNPRDFGYAVFGRVTKGMEVVDAIAAVRTDSCGYFQDVPVEPVLIRSAHLVPAGASK